MAFALPRQQARRLSGAALGPRPAGYTPASRSPTAAGPPCSCRAASLLGFTALAAIAVQRDSPGLLGAGWQAHTAWDALHYRGRGPTRVRSWYPPVCIGDDMALAAPLLTGRF